MKFSIIIPTYNNAEDLKECVQSIIKFTSRQEVEIIVVANGCTDGTESYLQIKASEGEVSTIWMEEPAGYPKAVNEGIKQAGGDFIILLNDDTVLLPQPVNQWIETLYAPFVNRQNKVGISGPHMMSKEESLNRDFMCFFCVMLRKEMIDEIGLLDEIFSPGYSEDIDYSFKAEAAGWKVVQVPDDSRAFYDDKEMKRTGNFAIYHKGTQTFSRPENKDEQLIIRNNAIIKERWGNYGFDGFKEEAPARETGIIPEEKSEPLVAVVMPQTVKTNWPDSAWFIPEPDLYGKFDTTKFIKQAEEAMQEAMQEKKEIDISRAQKIDGYMADSELEVLARLAQNAKVFIEVGSWHGKSTAAIVDHLPEGGVLYCVDTWKGSENEQDTNHASAKQDDGDHAFIEFLNNHFEDVRKGRIIPIRMDSGNAAFLFMEQNVRPDVIFIDAEHTFHAVTEDLVNWENVLANNGIMCGHDYGTNVWLEVTDAVNKFYGGKTVPDSLEHIPNTSIWKVDYSQFAVQPRMGRSLTPKRTTPCVFDCIPFNNELDILEIRLTELYDVVDRFIIVEARQTHSGMDKPLHFSENYMRFEKFLNKITVLVIEEFPDVDPSNPHWSRERYQRDFAAHGLTECIPNDVIISCDCDEIPLASTIESFKKNSFIVPRDGTDFVSLSMSLFYYNFHTRAYLPWEEGRLFNFYHLATKPSLTDIRYTKTKYGLTGGWHISYAGSSKDIVRKIEATAHQEYNQPMFKNVGTIQQRINNGEDVFGRPEIKFQKINVNDIDLPKWFEENKDNDKIRKYL